MSNIIECWFSLSHSLTHSIFLSQVSAGIGLRLIFVVFSIQVFKNLKLFMENKQEGDDLFDRLNVSISRIRISRLAK